MSTLRSICPICEATKKLLVCQGCMVMLYCCREHQIADRNDHKVACNAIKKAKANLEREERELRTTPSDFSMPENVFEAGVGHFWGILGTRDYMRARYALVEKLLKIKTYHAVKAAFDHMMDMFRLCRSDNMGLRFIVPALFVRLGNDQEAYDFLKWYVTTGSRGDYDWGDMDLPYLDVRDADVCESVNEFTGEYDDLAFAAAVMLIKMKLLKDVQLLQNSRFMYHFPNSPQLPTEIVDRIRKESVCKMVAKRTDIFKSEDQNPLIEELKKQLHQLFKFVQKSNKYFWSGLLNPADYLSARPISYSNGSEEQAQLTVQYYYDAFVETSDSIQMIREMVENDKK